MKCCILGSGTWGSALAQVLSDNGQDVIIYGRGIEEVNDINLNHVNSKYFGDDVKLSANIIANIIIPINIIVLLFHGSPFTIKYIGIKINAD